MQLRPFVGAHRTDEGHVPTVESRRDQFVEVLLVLDDPCDLERQIRCQRDVDRLGGSLVRMDPPEEEQVAAG